MTISTGRRCWAGAQPASRRRCSRPSRTNAWPGAAGGSSGLDAGTGWSPRRDRRSRSSPATPSWSMSRITTRGSAMARRSHRCRAGRRPHRGPGRVYFGLGVGLAASAEAHYGWRHWAIDWRGPGRAVRPSTRGHGAAAAAQPGRQSCRPAAPSRLWCGCLRRTRRLLTRRRICRNCRASRRRRAMRRSSSRRWRRRRSAASRSTRGSMRGSFQPRAAPGRRWGGRRYPAGWIASSSGSSTTLSCSFGSVRAITATTVSVWLGL